MINFGQGVPKNPAVYLEINLKSLKSIFNVKSIRPTFTLTKFPFLHNDTQTRLIGFTTLIKIPLKKLLVP